MLSAVASTVALWLLFARHALASPPSPEVVGITLPPVEKWFNDECAFNDYELLEIEYRIVEFFESDKIKELITSDEIAAQCCHEIKLVEFADVAGARARVLAVLGRYPQLYTGLLLYYISDPTALICLHKFFISELVSPPNPGAWPEHDETLYYFLLKVARIPSRLCSRGWINFARPDERSVLNLLTLLIVRSRWNPVFFAQGLPTFIDRIIAYCDSRDGYHNLAAEVVGVLNKMNSLRDRRYCTTVFTKLLAFDYANSMLGDAVIFELIRPEDDAAEFLLDALLNLWSTGSIQWDEGAVPIEPTSEVAVADSSSEAKLPEFCYKNRRLLARNPIHVVWLLYEKYYIDLPESSDEHVLPLWATVIDEFNALDPKLVYLHFYFCQKKLLFMFNREQPLQDYLDALSEANLIWLLKYSSEEEDYEIATSIDVLLDNMTQECQNRLQLWAARYLEEQGPVIDHSTTQNYYHSTLP
ncbi:hypothetical protein PAPHI01_1064 [Pancytospora philotis]|nr:hypothetical protein PAPHI01_1064 [Pancytospora philotis]